MFQRLRESLALVLIALLPFHALLVTVLTKWILGPGHAPMGELAIWKEAILTVILLVAVIELAMSYKLWALRRPWKMDLLDGLIISLLVLGVAVSAYSPQLTAYSFLYGFRYDFIPLIAFVILRRVSWSKRFMELLPTVIYYTGFVVVLYSLCTRLMPTEWFTWLGYSDLHSLYVPNGPLAPFQQIGGSDLQRVQGPMSGPNQLGLWLLIPLSVGLARLRGALGKAAQWRFLCYSVFTGLVILYSFSRAAWIGAAVIVALTFWPAIKSVSRRKLMSILSCIACLTVFAVLMYPAVILRVASSRGHIENPLKAIGTMIDHPLGLGLGTAGPASNRTSDTCVMLEEGSDPTWAVVHPNLCVFVGIFQVQPVERPCHCPFLPENWYLQIGVEMGWVGMILYMALVVVVMRRMALSYGLLAMSKTNSSSSQLIAHSLFLSFIALSIAALFLHAWEDSAAAYTVWILLATILGLRAYRTTP